MTSTDTERKTQLTMLAFAGDFITWGVGMTFINPSTVMPTFISHYTTNEYLIGMASTIQTGGWLLPQLLVSNLIAHLPRKKPFMLTSAILTRPLLWVFALFLLFSHGWSSSAILLVFFSIYTAFTLGDAMTSVAWFDIFGKSVPPARRGRVLGGAQIIMGILALGASRIAQYILSPSGPEFPFNYALCFAIAGAGTLLSLVSDLMITEVVQPVREQRLALNQYWPTLTRLLGTDHVFLRVTSARLLAGLANMALPFYIIFARNELGFGEAWLGTYISAQVAGSLVSGTVLGYISERSGSKAVILMALTLQSLAPLTALLVFFLGGALGAASPWIYAVVFTMIGVGQTSNLLGFINYVLELAPSEERVSYIGVTNTIGGLLAIAPLIGATLIQYISYTGLFVTTLGVLVGSLLVVLPMIEPRRRASTRDSQPTLVTE